MLMLNVVKAHIRFLVYPTQIGCYFPIYLDVCVCLPSGRTPKKNPTNNSSAFVFCISFVIMGISDCIIKVTLEAVSSFSWDAAEYLCLCFFCHLFPHLSESGDIKKPLKHGMKQGDKESIKTSYEEGAM